MKRTAFWGFAVLLALAPLPLGANRPWSESLVAFVAGAILFLWAFDVWRSGDRVSVPLRRHWPVSTIFLVLMVWFWVQIAAPVPAAWHHPIWAETRAALAGIDGTAPAARIGIDGAAGGGVLARFVAYGAIFWLALQFGRDVDRAARLLWVLTIAAFLYAVYGLSVQFSGWNTILWYDRWAYEDAVTGPFVNRNHFATYAGLGLLTTLALLWTEMRRKGGGGLSSRGGLLEFTDRVGPATYFLAGNFVLLLTALLLSDSRAGLLSALAGLAALVVALLIAYRRQLGGGLLAAALVAGSAYIVIDVSGGDTAARFAAMPREAQTRVRIYETAAAALADRTYLGTGLGSFSGVYYQRRGADVPVWAAHADRAHNGYLELAVEGGLPALVGMLVLFALLVVQCAAGVLRRRRDRVFPALGIAATVLVGLHTLVDFSLAVPAVGITVMAILGVACAQSWSNGKRPRSHGKRCHKTKSRRSVGSQLS
ncbi:MAG: O-antigen ligase family protein [Alphaproteobacteria bacterium]